MTDMNQIQDMLEKSDAEIKSSLQGYRSELNTLRDEVTQIMQKRTSMPAPSTKGGTGGRIRAILSEAGAAKSLESGAKSTGSIDLGLSIKALTSLQGSAADPAEGIDVQSERQPGLYGYAMRPLTLFDVMPSREIASNSLTFTRMASFTNAAAGQNGEGVEKAEQTIDPGLITAGIETVAVWHDASKQVLDDEPGLETTVSMLLLHGVREKAERQIINGDGGNAYTISGLVTEGIPFVPTVAPKADRIGECLAGMRNTGYAPSLVLVNPIDWFQIQSERAVSGDEQYVGPGWAVPTPPSVYGVSVVESPAVESGTAIVVDTRFVQLLDRMQPTVEMSRESGSNFKANLVTVLAEIRLGLAVYDKKAVQVIDLNATV